MPLGSVLRRRSLEGEGGAAQVTTSAKTARDTVTYTSLREGGWAGDVFVTSTVCVSRLRQRSEGRSASCCVLRMETILPASASGISAL